MHAVTTLLNLDDDDDDDDDDNECNGMHYNMPYVQKIPLTAKLICRKPLKCFLKNR